MLDFVDLLRLSGFEPGEVVVVRHAPVEKALRSVLPWLVAERPDLFLAYQQIQWPALETAMTRARYVASFVGQEPVTATFAGIYAIGEWQRLDHEGYRQFPGNAELEALGMSGRTPDQPECLAFELDPVDRCRDWIGRLIITWPKPYQTWWRWAHRARFEVRAITPESRFVRGIPDWKDLVLSWAELQVLPSSWQAALEQWRGIYLIYDTRRGASYVGSAYGADNILGRWRSYARTGHGGNRELRSSSFDSFRFSILQRTSPDMEPQDIIALEWSWKLRLHTREFGLNAN